MAGQLENNPKKHSQLNPNWAQLRQKLKSTGFQKHSEASEIETPTTILGKRKSRSGDDSGDPPPNPLIPTSSDSSVTDVIAMDCEMVGVSPLGNKSALGRVTLVNKWGNVIYDEFVRPVEYVVDFRTKISGIRPQHLKKAKDFRVVQKEVAELIEGRILVGHALRNDFKALLLSHPKQDIRDTSEYQPLQREGRGRALRHLATEVLGVEIQNGEHCPKLDGTIVRYFDSCQNPIPACSQPNAEADVEVCLEDVQDAEDVAEFKVDSDVPTENSIPVANSEIEDARAAMILYLKHRKQWEKSIKDFARLKKKQRKRKPKKKKHLSNVENAS